MLSATTDSWTSAPLRPDGSAHVGLRALLRAETQGAHGQVDREFGRFDLSMPEHYRAFLEASAAALLPVEQALTANHVAELLPDWPKRTRSSAIEHDISRIGGTVQPLTVLEPLGLEAMWGTLYVLEGSRLGGQVLLRQVQRSPDPSVRATTSYLGHGSGLGLWTSFLVALEHFGASLPDEAKVIRAAQRTFEIFRVAAADRTRPAPCPLAELAPS